MTRLALNWWSQPLGLDLPTRNRRGSSIAVLALTCALASACTSDSIASDPLLCGFDGDASPGYQDVSLNGSVGATQAPAGSTVLLEARVSAELVRLDLCNTDVVWEVRTGGGTVAQAESNTGPVDPMALDYVATNTWTLGPTAGAQTVYLYVKDDPSINTLLTVTATGGFGTNLLLNPGFEASDVVVGGLPSSAGAWQGDLAARVASDQGIGQHAGAYMLKFTATGLVAGAGFFTSQQWQTVDLRGYATLIDQGKVRLDASAWVNRVAGDAETDTRFDLRVLAFPGTPAGFPTDYPPPAGQIRSATINSTAGSWQQLQVLFDVLPAGTRYAAVELYPYENVMDDGTLPEFDGHYADDVSLVLTQLP